MSPRTIEQFEEIRESRKLQIMKVALELFAHEGYHTVSIARIAEQAGISKGLLYNYFSSKEDLLDSIMAFGIGKFHDILNQIQDELDTPEELRTYIHGGFALIRREPVFYRLFFSVFFQPGVMDSMQNQFRQTVEQLTREVAHYYNAKGDPAPYEKALLLGFTIDGVGLHYFLSPEAVDLDKMEKIIFELFK